MEHQTAWLDVNSPNVILLYGIRQNYAAFLIFCQSVTNKAKDILLELGGIIKNSIGLQTGQSRSDLVHVRKVRVKVRVKSIVKSFRS